MTFADPSQCTVGHCANTLAEADEHAAHVADAADDLHAGRAAGQHEDTGAAAGAADLLAVEVENERAAVDRRTNEQSVSEAGLTEHRITGL